MAEFMCQHCLDFAECQDIDQRQSDFEILLRREKQVEDRQVVENRRVHTCRQVDPLGSRRTGLVGQSVQKCEQARLIGSRHFNIIRRTAALDEEQRLQHEDCEKAGATTDQEMQERTRAAGQPFIDHAVCRPREPARQR